MKKAKPLDVQKIKQTQQRWAKAEAKCKDMRVLEDEAYKKHFPESLKAYKAAPKVEAGGPSAEQFSPNSYPAEHELHQAKGADPLIELEIQQRMMRLCQNVADKDLSSQDYTLRTMMTAWLVTSGWCEPDEAQRVRDLRATFDALLMAAEGVLACTPRDMPKAYGLLSSAVVKARGAKP